jgi:hypothetical protein
MYSFSYVLLIFLALGRCMRQYNRVENCKKKNNDTEALSVWLGVVVTTAVLADKPSTTGSMPIGFHGTAYITATR